MLVQLQPDLYQLRSFMVRSYLLREGDRLCLIDGGFLGAINLIEQSLERERLAWTDIDTILLTHGHLDHTYNLKRICKLSGAKVFAHSEDADHISGTHKYRGPSLACAFLEFCGRMLFRYQAIGEFEKLADGQTINSYGGIQVLHTPGHTAGHCCFHWKKHDLLFTGDLFATGQKRTFLPPPFLNSCPQRFEQSLNRIYQLNPSGILSNHCDRADAKTQKQRFFENRMKR